MHFISGTSIDEHVLRAFNVLIHLLILKHHKDCNYQIFRYEDIIKLKIL